MRKYINEIYGIKFYSDGMMPIDELRIEQKKHDDFVDAIRYSFIALKQKEPWYKKLMRRIRRMLEISRVFTIIASIIIVTGIYMMLFNWINGLALEILGWTVLITLWLASEKKL